MKKKVFAVIALFMCVFVFAGCSDKGIQGKWELYEEIESDGNKISKKELEDMHINERLTDLYVISKGLAYPLWCCREKASVYVLDRRDISRVIHCLNQDA